MAISCKTNIVLLAIGMLLIVAGTITARDGISQISTDDATARLSGGGCPCPSAYEWYKRAEQTTKCDDSEKFCDDWTTDVCTSKKEQIQQNRNGQIPITEDVCVDDSTKCCRIDEHEEPILCAKVYQCKLDTGGESCTQGIRRTDLDVETDAWSSSTKPVDNYDY